MSRSSPSLFRQAVRLLLAAGAFSFLCFAAFAEEDKLPLVLTPEPGISARVEKRGGDYVLVQPDGRRLTLMTQEDIDAQGTSPFFDEEDYDYDGHPDLAVGLPAGMVDIGYGLYLYDSGSKSYAMFDVPDAVADRQNCGGFWSIERLPERKAIYSTCRGGARWHHDVLRIEPDRSVWIVEQSRVPEDAVDWPYFSKPMRSVSYDRRGNILSEDVISPEEREEVWDVPVERLALYSAPQETARTRAYLIRGDVAIILAFRGDDWMKIAYNGRKDRIERWVSLKDAYDLAARYDPQQPPPAPLALSAADYSGNTEDPDYYRNLFTLSLDNRGQGDIRIGHGEIHLIFTGPDGKSVPHKLYDIGDFTLTPGQSRLLDDNVIEKHGETHVIFHGSSAGDGYVPFFPPGLAPGRYTVRPVLTDPDLSGPLYAKEEIPIDYPPRLRADLVKAAP
ncbi:hypothetical protein NOF55_19975 [Rhizobiaceae bacterium BDR2-2]|uniref:Uncharacterized protein n=1 Tax=Ectorhizobium quercum TaxID=2965071 RepID=A0AAE3N486_9HYPH|nr:hypothetical protein [Ectorhizobium quercum]MCX8999389.1 hypothetical protein [Ectorhizobium quercum]